jgi:hypothetical protein
MGDHDPLPADGARLADAETPAPAPTATAPRRPRRRRGGAGARRRREGEKSRAATYFVVFAVIVVTVPLLWAAGELVFVGSQASPGTGRCLVRMVSSAHLGGRYLELILAILAFGSALVAKKVEFVQRWRILVYGSAIGIASCLVILIRVQEGTDALHMLSEIACDAPLAAKALDQLHSDFTWYAIAAIGWYCLIIATQLGLQLPKFPSSDRAADG